MEKIVFLDRGTLAVPMRKPAFPHEWVDYDRTAPGDTIQRLLGATMAITNKVKIHKPELDQLPMLRFIAVAATGYDCVDLVACRLRGIQVANVPSYTGVSVPEHVFLLLLALSRNLLSYQQAVREGRWNHAPHFTMLDYPVNNLSGRVLGLVGHGEIAKEVEKRARAFGMEILIAERKETPATRSGRRPFEEVLRRSDIISLHTPLTPETRGLIGATELALMKPHAIFINTARGGLVDETALADALKMGRLGGAGIDVLSQEPPREGNPLLDLNLPNLIVTPHIAWSSLESFHTLAKKLVDNIEAFVRGQPQNIVN